MTARIVMINQVKLLVEVDELEAVRPTRTASQAAADHLASRGLEPTGVGDRITDITGDLRDTLSAVIAPLRETLNAAAPDEWTVEFSLGFKGEAGIPCITKGEANGSIKVTAKWKTGG